MPRYLVRLQRTTTVTEFGFTDVEAEDPMQAKQIVRQKCIDGACWDRDQVSTQVHEVVGFVLPWVAPPDMSAEPDLALAEVRHPGGQKP